MKINSILKSIDLKKKIMVSIFGLSLALGTMLVVDKENINVIKEEQILISEMTNKTLNISFVPNNPDMKDNINLFNPITDSDLSNIEKIHGVKSVKPINAEFDPLSGYAKINNESSYIEIYGYDEKGTDINKDKIEILYGRNLNAKDVGKNVIVLNMETVNSMRISDAKSLLGSGLEINGSVYEIVGIMNVVTVDERDNTNDLAYSSLIPKSTSKEILSRANSKVGVYGAISVQIKDGYNINSIESSIYNLLYQAHENISGYYERDAEYSLPKKLGPTIVILDNFIKGYNIVTYTLIVIAIASILKVLRLTKRKKEDVVDSFIDNKDNISDEIADLATENNTEILDGENNESLDDNDAVSEVSEDTKEEDNKEIEETKEENNISEDVDKNENKDILINSLCVLIIGLMASHFLASYYLLDMNIVKLFDIAIITKIVTLLISSCLMMIKK